MRSFRHYGTSPPSVSSSLKNQFKPLLHSSSLHVNAFFPSQKRGLFITTHNNAILQMVSSSPAPSPPKPAPTFIFSPQDDNSMASIIQTMTSIQQGEQRKLGK